MIEAGLKQKAFGFQQILYSRKKVNLLKNTQLINLSQSTIQITTATSSEHHEHVALPIHVLHFVKIPQLANPVNVEGQLVY